MPKLSNIRRIIPEDVEEDSTPVDVIESVADSYNDFADELFEILNGQLDFENLNRAKISLDLSFDATGKPVGNALISTNLAFVSMLYIGKIQNVTNAAERITQVPYLDWSYQGNGVVKINYGVGFLPGKKYKLTLELIP